MLIQSQENMLFNKEISEIYIPNWVFMDYVVNTD